MTLLRSCGKKLLALGDMEEIVAYLKAEVSSLMQTLYRIEVTSTKLAAC